MEGSCEHDNELLGSMNGREFLDWLKEDSASLN